jgi:hypothetical protein
MHARIVVLAWLILVSTGAWGFDESGTTAVAPLSRLRASFTKTNV